MLNKKKRELLYSLPHHTQELVRKVLGNQDSTNITILFINMSK